MALQPLRQIVLVDHVEPVEDHAVPDHPANDGHAKLKPDAQSAQIIVSKQLVPNAREKVSAKVLQEKE